MERKPRLLVAAKVAAQLIPSTWTTPDAEWHPVLMFINRDGGAKTGMFDPTLMGDDKLKDTLAYIHQALKDGGAQEAVLVTPIWWALADESRPDIRARDREDRREMVMAVYVNHEDTLAEIAEIFRDPPQLGEWQSGYEDLEIGGAVANILRSAIG